ncbi:MAG: hypothetical protein LBU24_03880 [Methanocalculaceae archaeon]|jgi:hypothetical protein|nr:hypothetical protein [Methanocalculaceae archaeon]
MSVKNYLMELNADPKLQQEFVVSKLAIGTTFAEKKGFGVTVKDFELVDAASLWQERGRDYRCTATESVGVESCIHYLGK